MYSFSDMYLVVVTKKKLEKGKKNFKLNTYTYL